MKILKILSLSNLLLGCTFSSSSWAMQEESREWPPEIRWKIVQMVYRPSPTQSIPMEEQPREYHRTTDWEALTTFRTLSQDWKHTVDAVILNYTTHHFKEHDDSWYYDLRSTLRIKLTAQNYTKEGLSEMAPLVYAISLKGSDWGLTNAQNMGTAITTHSFCNLRHLTYDVQNSSVDDAGTISVATAFEHLPKLKICSLWGDIGPLGMRALTRAFKNLSNLEELNISGNFTNDTIDRLGISFTDLVGQSSGELLGQSLHHLSGLKKLSISSDMSPADTQEFAEGLPHLKELRDLSLTWHPAIDPNSLGVMERLTVEIDAIQLTILGHCKIMKTIKLLDKLAFLRLTTFRNDEITFLPDQKRQEWIRKISKHPNSAKLRYQF